EWRHRIALFLFSGNRRDDEVLALNISDDVVSLFLFLYVDLVLLEILVEVPDLQALFLDSNKPGIERRRQSSRKIRRDRPVFGRNEGEYLLYPLPHQPQGARLYASRREAAPHLVPEQRADLIA